MQFQELANALRGELITPEGDDYDRHRSLYNAMIDKKPAAIARCVDAADVQACVNFARDNDVPLAIRSGGHNAGGLGSIAVGAMDAEAADATIKRLRTLTDRPFQVNVFAHPTPRRDLARETAWIAAFLVEAEDTADLPVSEGRSPYGPMQRFYFTTGLGEPACHEAPDALLIQSPDGAPVTLAVNDLPLTIGSTVALYTQPVDSELALVYAREQGRSREPLPKNRNGLAVLDHTVHQHGAVSDLDDAERIDTRKGIASDPFASLHALEKESWLKRSQLQIGRNRGIQIGGDVERRFHLLPASSSAGRSPLRSSP